MTAAPWFIRWNCGTVVHQVEYSDIPTERGAAFVEQIVNDERANAYAMVAAVNAAHGAGLSTEALKAGVLNKLIEACELIGAWTALPADGVEARDELNRRVSVIREALALRRAALAKAGVRP
jgi:hypothetical protein